LKVHFSIIFPPGSISPKWYTFLQHTKIVNNVKGKAVPLQDWSGPEGSRKLRYTYNVKDKAVPSQVWSGPEGSRKLRYTDNVKGKAAP
jgi:hypothetical protein